MLKSTATGCNVHKKSPLTYAEMDAEIEHTLKALRAACGDNVDKIMERLHSEIRVAVFKDLAQKRSECLAWDQALRDALKAQRAGNFTLQSTDDAAQGALALITNGQGCYAGESDASDRTPRRNSRRGKDSTDDKEFNKDIKALVVDIVEKKLKSHGQVDRIHCTNCGKTHFGGAKACRAPRQQQSDRERGSQSDGSGGQSARSNRRQTGSQQRSPAEKRAMRAAAAVSAEDDEEDEVWDDEDFDDISIKTGDNYSVSLLAASIPLPINAYVASQKHWQVCAHPDTQAEVSITPHKEHVRVLRKEFIKLKGVVEGASLKARAAHLAFPLLTTTGRKYHLVIATPGLYHPSAAAVILAHHDLEKAGLLVDYSKGTATTPIGESIAMRKHGNVWVMPLADSQARPAQHHQEKVSTSLTVSLKDQTAGLRAANIGHQCSMHAGATSCCKLYDATHGAGWGGASKADIRQVRASCAVCSLGKGPADYHPRTRTPAPAAATRPTPAPEPRVPTVRFLGKNQQRTVSRWMPSCPQREKDRAQIRMNMSIRRELTTSLPDILNSLDLTSEVQLQLHLTVAFRDVPVQQDAGPKARHHGAMTERYSEVRPSPGYDKKTTTKETLSEVRTGMRPLTRSQDMQRRRDAANSPPARRKTTASSAPHVSIQGESAQGESCAALPTSNVGERNQSGLRATQPDPSGPRIFRSRTAKSMSRHLGIL